MQIQCGSSSAGKIMIVCVPLPSSTCLVFKEHGSFFVTVEEMESVLCPRLPEMMAYSTAQTGPEYDLFGRVKNYSV